MKQAIENILRDTFAPVVLEVRDDSAKHAGHVGARESGGGHFQVLIVSRQFAGQSRLQRHRQIYAVLKPHFSGDIHALGLTALTPDEHHSA